MIDHELALELKDAGFPQKGANWDYSHEHGRGQFLYFPILSELIEACNPAQFDDFGLSTGYTDQWEAWATYHGHAIPEVDMRVKGRTPEEAVARLYLALHKKDV